MKPLSALFIIAFTACSHPAVKPVATAATDTLVKRNIIERGMPIDSAYGAGTSFDSANFHVAINYYVSGAKLMEEYIDTVTGIKDLKEYYENGQLKEAGKLTTTTSPTRIGTWRFYAENGRTDSVVDYDAKYKITYYMAVQIAAREGYNKPRTEISLQTEDKKTYWWVDEWHVMEGGGGETARTILINAESGEVSRPKNCFQLMKVC